MTTTTPARLLRLLSLLQTRREWSGAELAARLGVTERTVRRDVGRLRELGYPVDSTTGTAGGYRLASGRDVPPLLLDDDEAVAVATGLITAAGIAGIEETALRALAKLTQVLPDRLRRRVATVAETASAVRDRRVPRLDAGVLAVLTAAARDREIVTFDHERRDGTRMARRVEPHQLLTAYGPWYLLAFDLVRDDWRIFRVDRIERVASVRHRFTPRPLPEGGAAAFLGRSLAAAPYPYSASVTVHAPVEVVTARRPLLLPGRIERLDRNRCRVQLAADTLDALAQDIVALGADIELDAPPAVRDHLQKVGNRLLGAAQSTKPVVE